ncbi:MAG: chitobiase/beta-hexosaminidase C-terminal domain-containing protein [Bacteroidales bacterium]|nr:chitobiase/beta-hexosaminidase C-terminal domain-containing protein [Bacteroidales bacterium]
MRKKFTLLIAALALLVFMTPSLAGWGQTRTETQLLSEDFSSITSGDNTTTGGSSNPWTDENENFPNTGRTNVYKAGGAIKLGASSKTGTITSKSLTVEAGTLTVDFDVKGWTTVEGNIKVTVGSQNETVTYTAKMSDDFESKSVNFTITDAGSMTVKLETTAKRAFLDNIVITNTTSGGGGSDTYTVTYNANDATSGDVPEDTNEYGSGDEVTVLGNTGNLAKTHYSFGGWCMNTQGTGTVYGPAPLETSFVISGSTTLYAKWNPNTNTVTLPANDQYGTYTMDATNPVAYGTTVNLTYTPVSGYESYAATWSVNGSAIEGNSFTMPDQAVTVTVELEQVMNATFVFNTDAGLTALGIEKPTTSGTGTDLDPNTDYTSGIVTMNITHGGTNTRVWNNGGTTTELRVYNGNNNNNNVDGTLTFSVPNGVLITGITFSCASGYVLSDWSSNTGEQSVTFTASAQKRIYTATVAYTSTSAVLPPSFNPSAGTYNANQSVEISCTTSGADIHYTTNGDAPTTSSALYEGAITVDRNMTIKAIAIKDSQTSEPAEAQYVLTPLEPTFSPVGGPYTGAQTVTISCETSGVTLSYKLGDGAWTTYENPVTVSESTTLYAKATKANWTDREASATYTITQPLANIAALTANTTADDYLVTLSDAVVTYVNGNYAYIQDASGAVLYYKSNHGLTAGKTFNGTATVSYQLRYGNPQITNLSGITPTDGTAPSPTSVAQSAWNYTFTNVIGQYFQITGATITQNDNNNKYYVSLGGQDIQLYKVGTAISSLDLTKTYTITGFPTIYVNGDNTTYELTIFAAPEEETSPNPAITVTPNTISDVPASGDYYNLNVTVANIDNVDVDNFSVDYCNSDGSDITGDKPTIIDDYEFTANTQGEGYILTIGFNANDGAARAAYFEVIYGNSGTNVESNVITVTQEAYVVPVPTITITPEAINNIPVTGEYYNLNVAVANIDNVDVNNFSVDYCNSDGSDITGDKPTMIDEYEFSANTQGEDYILTIGFNANDGAARTAYFIVKYTYDEAKTEVVIPSNVVTASQAGVAVPGSWVLTPLTDLTPADVFVIVGTYTADGSSYAITNNNGTSNATAASVSIENGVLSGTVNEEIQWNMSGDATNGYTFYPVGSATTWLYNTSSAAPCKVGNNENKKYVYDTDYGYLKNVGTSKYIGIYFGNNTTDWRGYVLTNQNEIHNNIAGQTFSFYKKVSDNVSYTKVIDGYITNYDEETNKNGDYYLIASPVCDVNPVDANMISDDMLSGPGFVANNATYDLYYFDQNEDDEWRNYRSEQFSLIPGKGYLYASKTGTTITFEGQPYLGNGIVDIEYSDGADFAGWNLIGNPFPTAATFNGEMAFYKINPDNGRNELIVQTGDRTVEAMEGVFVLGNATTTTVTFTKVANSNPVSPNVINIEVLQAVTNTRGVSNQLVDRAIVRFDNGSTLPKFMLNADNTKIYIPQEGKDMAIVDASNQGEMPVNFKASANGTYTLSVNPENVEMEYLHLIDNMTGADVDLLATPSYSFEARTTDYASRFRLVFSANNGSNENGNETFAYYNGSEWVISNMGDATLQVVDVMGRVLSSETVSGNANVSLNQTPGVYMLRLVNNENVRTQKIVVR